MDPMGNHAIFFLFGGAGCHFCVFEGCLWRVLVLLKLRHHRFRTIEDDGVTSWQSKVPPPKLPLIRPY